MMMPQFWNYSLTLKTARIMKINQYWNYSLTVNTARMMKINQYWNCIHPYPEDSDDDEYASAL
jgi:hypothetical protein